MSAIENIDYSEAYAAVVQAMPKYSEVHKQFAPVLAKDYMVKLSTRILGDDTQMKSSETVEKMCLFPSRVQKYVKETGKTELEIYDLANI